MDGRHADEYYGARVAPVAQLDRVLPSEGSGRGFESRLVHHLLSLVQGSSVKTTILQSSLASRREPGESSRACISVFFQQNAGQVKFLWASDERLVTIAGVLRRAGRVAEGAPLLREYTSKGCRGFESPVLRHILRSTVLHTVHKCVPLFKGTASPPLSK